MQKKNNRQRLFGMLAGLILPPVSLWLIMVLRPEYEVINLIDPQFMLEVSFQMLALGMLGNGLFFFLALRLNKDEFSRGVLLSSIVWLAVIALVKFIWL